MFRVALAVVGGVVNQMAMPKYSRLTRSCLAVMGAMVLSGCRPSEPVPSYNEDVGTDGTVLLPTSSPWYDAAVEKGQADWRPFRKPGAEAKPVEPAVGEVKTAGTKQDVESALRGLVDDFNAAVAEGKFDEAIDFLVEQQVAPARQAAEAFPVFAAKIKELSEVLPGDNENLKKLVPTLSLEALFRLEVNSITASSKTEATGKLDGAEAALGDIRFILVHRDEETWYIDHPRLRPLGQVLPTLQQVTPQLDALISAVKSGQLAGEALAQQAAMINEMFGRLVPDGSKAGAETTQDEPERVAKPEEGG